MTAVDIVAYDNSVIFVSTLLQSPNTYDQSGCNMADSHNCYFYGSGNIQQEGCDVLTTGTQYIVKCIKANSDGSCNIKVGIEYACYAVTEAPSPAGSTPTPTPNSTTLSPTPSSTTPSPTKSYAISHFSYMLPSVLLLVANLWLS
ncbi:hypothetical protein THRCLA_20857 [Thraustotheca clavata]|uniref:Uncharacterized protein n=1 Tax=Thraustotheca clavata TaxID=74557 RepID=A0A1W0A2P9_9STRA|nr:hypothetical protein THRCLA_20857 [Thraustotheca clavata]